MDLRVDKGNCRQPKNTEKSSTSSTVTRNPDSAAHTSDSNSSVKIIHESGPAILQIIENPQDGSELCFVSGQPVNPLAIFEETAQQHQSNAMNAASSVVNPGESDSRAGTSTVTGTTTKTAKRSISHSQTDVQTDQRRTEKAPRKSTVVVGPSETPCDARLLRLNKFTSGTSGCKYGVAAGIMDFGKVKTSCI